MARYVLLQTSLDPLPIKRLARAFVASGARVSLDAPTVARYAFGVLLDDLSATAASSLAGALDAEGIAVDACAESELPMLPRARVLHRAEMTADGLVYHTSQDRTRLVPWGMMRIIAMGSIRRRPRATLRLHLPDIDELIETLDVEDLQKHEDLVLELLCDGETPRLRIIADEFLYTCLGARMRSRARENFVLLAHEILERCDVMPNRGAARFHLGHPEWFTYPGWSAFDEETRWLMWKIRWNVDRDARPDDPPPSATAPAARRPKGR